MPKEIGRFSCHGDFTTANVKVGERTKTFKYGFGTNGDPDDPASPKMDINEIMECLKKNLEKDFEGVAVKSTSSRGGIIYAERTKDA